MNNIDNLLYIIMSLAVLAIVAPGVFRINRGVALRNIGIWVAIFALLGVFYKNFGPDSEKPLFKMPESIALQQEHWKAQDANKAAIKSDAPQPDKAKPEKNDQEQVGKITSPEVFEH